MIIGDTHDDYTIIAAIPDGIDAFMCVGRMELSGKAPFFSVIRAWFTGEKQLVYQIKHEGIMVQEVAIVEMFTKAGYELPYRADTDVCS